MSENTRRVRSAQVLIVDPDPVSADRLAAVSAEASGLAAITANATATALRRLPTTVALVVRPPLDHCLSVFLNHVAALAPGLTVIVLDAPAGQSLQIPPGLDVTAVAETSALRRILRAFSDDASEPMAPAVDHIALRTGLRRAGEAALRAGTAAAVPAELRLPVLEAMPAAIAVALLAVGELHSEVSVTGTRAPVAVDVARDACRQLIDHYAAMAGEDIAWDRDALELFVEGEVLADTGADDLAQQALTCATLTAAGRPIGLLAAVLAADVRPDRADVMFLRDMAAPVSTIILALRRLSELTGEDPLTGLDNRGRLSEKLARLIRRARDSGEPLSVMIIDVDHFKTINDSCGHMAGDGVLSELARLLRSVLRPGDAVARYGGDEFVVALPRTPVGDAENVGNRVLRAVKAHTFCDSRERIRFTVSIGIAGGTQPGGETELLSRADLALYRAKRLGRARVCVHNAAFAKDVRNFRDHFADAERAGADSTSDGGPAARVLVVDDEQDITFVVTHMLQDRYTMEASHRISEAIARLRSGTGDYDVLLLDINLPDGSGFDVLEVAGALPRPPVTIMLSGHASAENALRSLQFGAYDFITKPFTLEGLRATVARAVELRRLRLENEVYQGHLEGLVRERSASLAAALAETRRSYRFTLEALVELLDRRRSGTSDHSRRLRVISLVFGRILGLTAKELDDLDKAAWVHDIGKLAMPDRILLKAGPLTDAERELMRSHAEIGYRVLHQDPYLSQAAEIVRSHHERYDGKGYPRGLAGGAISLGTRLFSLTDVYDALRSDRVYRASMTVDKAAAELQKNAGSMFDPELVEVFLCHLPEIEAAIPWPNPAPARADAIAATARGRAAAR